MMNLQTMHDHVSAYLTSKGFKDWSVCKPFDSKDSTNTPVMECRVTLSENEVDQRVKVIVLRESWIMRGGMEYGSRDIQALMWVCDSLGKQLSIANITDEAAINAFLEQHILSGEALAAYKQEVNQEQQREWRLNDAVQHCVREQDINEMVQTVMRASIARLEQRDALALRSRLSELAIAADPPQLAIGDGAGGTAPININPNKPITISTLAAEMGYRFDNGELQKIGKKMAAAYREKYGENPGKHEQLVGQASIMVNSYTERDWKLVEKVIVDFINNE